MNKEIQNHSSALDIDQIWTAIEPQVDLINEQRNKRKPIFLYWLSGLALLVGISIAGFLLLNQEPVDMAPPVTTSATANSRVAVAPVGSENEKPTLPIESVSKVTTTSSPVVVASTARRVETIVNNKTAASVAIEKSPESGMTKTQLPATQSIKSTTAEFINAPLSRFKTETELSKNKKLTTAMTNLSALPVGNHTIKIAEQELPALNFSIKNNKSLAKLPMYRDRPTISVEFQAGISAVNRTLGTTGNNNFIIDSAATELRGTLVELRNTFEEPLEALHANLLVNAHFPSGFYISSGVGYTRIAELYSNFSTQSEVVIDSMGIQKRVIGITGDTIDIIGPVATTVTTNFSKKYYNSFQMVDIPIFVGYQYDFGDWKTDFSLGVFANILLATDGRIPNTPTTDIDLSENGDDLYRSRVDFSWQFGLGITRSLTEKISLRINPNFRYYSKNFMKENTGLNQRYLLFGGTMGLRFDL